MVFLLVNILEVFPGGTVVNNPPANAGDTGDMDSIPEFGRAPGGYCSILAWRIPWTEESGKLQSMRSQRAGHD